MKHTLRTRFLPVCFALSLLLPFSAGAELDGVEIETVEVGSPAETDDLPAAEPLLPIDFSYGAAPDAANASEYKDENGQLIRVYEDSTIKAVITETNWMKTDIWYADVTISDASQLRTISWGDGDFSNSKARGKAIRLAEHVNAVIALNGDSWGAAEKRGYGVVFRQGNLISNRLDDSGKTRMDLLLIDDRGDFHGIHAAQEGDLDDPSVFEGRRIVNVFCFGPILVENGEAVTDYQGTDRNGKDGTWMNMRTDEPAQRAILCQTGPLSYRIVTSAGHRSGNRGLTLPEITEYLLSMGDVQFAYNLDGGESAMLYYPFAEKSKINMKNTDIRELWDIIYFATAEE